MGFFEELKRRNVFRVGIAYTVASWLLLQITDVLMALLDLPVSTGKVVLLLLVISFVPALVFAWAYEITPEGLKRDTEVDPQKSIAHFTASKLDKITLIMVAAVIVMIVLDRMIPEEASSEQAEPSSVITAGAPSIAVLPFADLSPEQDQAFFADGISEELLNLLVRVDGLKVASRTSAFSYKGSQKKLFEIADELQVKYILEGSVRKAERQVRITAQLIDADTDRHLWSDAYDRELTDIFRIQEEIANKIVVALQTELGMLQNVGEIEVNADTDNLDAYELYLEGRGLFLSRSNVGRSIELLTAAVELDPDFARAWEDLGAAYSVAEGWGVEGEGFEQKALEASLKALSLEPGLSMAHAVVASVYIDIERDFVRAMPEFDLAIQNDPLNATAWFWRGLNYARLRFAEKAISDISRCIELDPAYFNCYRHLARVYLIAGDQEKALETYLVNLNQGLSTHDFWMVPVFLDAGMNHAAALLLLRESGGDPGYPIKELLKALKHPEADHSEGIAKLEQWVLNGDSHSKWWGAEWVALGAYDRVEPNIDSNRIWTDAYRSFRASEYFKPVVNKLGFPAYWRAQGFPPQCRPMGEDDFECD